MTEEKVQQSTLENVSYVISPIAGERMTLPTAAEEKAVQRKLDWHILPLLFLVYTFSNLDRSNLGNARLAGLPQSVNLEGKRYDWLGTAFYISYICSQWTAVGFKRFPPHIWVFCAAIGFSTISACQAAVTNYPSLVALRVLLGCFEGMFSGVPLYLSFFYPKEKVGFRQGIFLSGSALANAYGCVLGYAILGIRGPVAPWRCLFLIEGLPVWIVAVLVWLYLPDDLISARFLTDREKEVDWQCIARGQTVDSQGVGGADGLLIVSGYVPGLMYFCCNVCFGSLPLFVPTIISEKGDFDHQASNGLSAPPYGLCFVMILLCAFDSDRAKIRGPFVAAAATVSTVGYCLLGVSSAVTARYIGVFLSVQIFVNISILLPWVSSVHRTESKRAGGWAIFATLGQFGPLVGTNIFPKDQGPYYHKGVWISCGFTSLVILLSLSYSILLGLENRRMDCLIRPSPTYKLARLEEIVEAPFHYHIKCHEILIDTIRAFSNVINEEDQGGNFLLPLIRIFSTQVEVLSVPPRNDFSTEVLDVVSRLDATQDFSFYASNSYTRMALLAAFCILSIVRSPLREQIDLRDAEQSIFKAISFVKRRSIQNGDLDERYGTILSQLWSNSSNSLNMAAPNYGLDLKIRSRLFMSVVFDSLWWWRVEYNGQGSPYDTDKNVPQAVQADMEDGSTRWSPTTAPVSDSFGSINLPEFYMDWNFPMNIDYIG
ncbi:hypothetical protein HYE67_005025 [Fusarium culmorum]|uniref:Major facilitator superfamily (MFS) profile domain-containing protein n=1 Tax=Fusarium culmorum TaxID=5516 RepID=A0A7S8D691_FUSCU|nr:hypothetical protein HYE67_005025 [Fusarium culmorum]